MSCVMLRTSDIKHAPRCTSAWLWSIINLETYVFPGLLLELIFSFYLELIWS